MSQKVQRAKDIVYYLRTKHGLTQKDLAKKAKISNVTISDIESGKVMPLPETLEKIANVFGMDIVELLQFDVTRLDNRLVKEITSEDKALLDWATNPENLEYIRFVYNIAKKGVSTSMIQNLRVELI